MRVIRVEEDDNDGSAALWIVAGAVLGVAAGAMVAEAMSGRRVTIQGAWSRTRRLADKAIDQWEPIADAAASLKDAWLSRGDDSDEDDEDWDEFDDEELDDDSDDSDDSDDDSDDDIDDSDDDLEDEDDLDEDDSDDLDEDLDDEDFDDSDDEDGAGSAPPIDERVLEAFSNDPVLSERDIEIEATDEAGIILHGLVDSPREVAHAVTLARGVPGVEGVKQRLRVRERR